MLFFSLAFFFAESLLPFQPLLLCLMDSAADDLTTSLPLTDVLTRKSNAPPGGPHFGSNSQLYGAKPASNARGWGGWVVLEMTGTY